MRYHGIDMPDPDFSGGGAFQIGGEGVDPEDSGFQAADEECRPILDDIFPGRGGAGEVSTNEDE